MALPTWSPAVGSMRDGDLAEMAPAGTEVGVCRAGVVDVENANWQGGAITPRNVAEMRGITAAWTKSCFTPDERP